MASRKRKKVVAVSSELISAVPSTPEPTPQKADHNHLYVRVGAVRDDEFMEQCSICADMRRM